MCVMIDSVTSQKGHKSEGQEWQPKIKQAMDSTQTQRVGSQARSQDGGLKVLHPLIRGAPFSARVRQMSLWWHSTS